MSPSVAQILRKAERHSKKGESDLAAQQYESILQKYPQNKQAIAGLKALQQPDPIVKAANRQTFQAQIDGLIALYNQGKLKQALEAGEALEKQFPNTPYIPNLLGVVNTGLGRLEQAVAGFEKALAIKPDYAAAYNNMGGALMDKAEPDAAIESFKMALKIKPDYANPKHLIAALTGSTTATAPRVYVESLFDNYAFRFDTSLVQKLNYKIPEALAQIILTNKTGSSLGPILDLGCGTGLAGVARQKNIYDRLIHIDLIEYLSSADLDFDYFVSTDVFVYIGELSDVFHLIKSRNKRAGRLAFSTEHTEKEGYFLETSGRYSHSKAYIEELCEKFEYKISHFSTTKLRKEKKSYLTGGLYLLDFAPKPYPDHGRDYQIDFTMTELYFTCTNGTDKLEIEVRSG